MLTSGYKAKALARAARAAALIGSACAAAASPAPGGPPTGTVVVRLDPAYPPAAAGYHWTYLELRLACDAGAWRRHFWAHGLYYNQADRGRIVEATAAGEACRVVGEIHLTHPSWAQYGSVEFSLDLALDGPRVKGTYACRYGDNVLRGRVAGSVRPLPARVAGFAPPARGEHPRLVFRRDRLPALRAKADSPMGMAVLRRLRRCLAGTVELADAAAGHGLLYQLTGDDRHAVQAHRLIERSFRGPFPFRGCWLETAPVLLCEALAYDFCCEAWQGEERRRIARVLLDRARHVGSGSTHGYHRKRCPSWSQIARAAAGVAVLAVRGDAELLGDKPALPRVVCVPAVEGPLPQRGSPVGPFEDDRMPEAWLYAGPFAPPPPTACGPALTEAEPDFLADLGGAAAARPFCGAAVRFKGLTRTFRRLEAEAIAVSTARADRLCLHALRAAHGAAPSVGYFYTVIRNDRSRIVRAALSGEGATARVWLAGRPVEDGRFLQLPPGLLPLMVQAAADADDEPYRYGPRSCWILPRFNTVTPEQIRSSHEEALAAWHEAAAGRGDTLDVRLLELFQRSVVNYLDGHGEHGWNPDGDHYLGLAMTSGVFAFVQALRNVEGIDLAGGTGVDWVVPLWAMRMVPTPAGPAHPRYGGDYRAVMTHPHGVAMGLSLVPAKLLPAAVWALRHTWGEQAEKVFVSSALEAIYGFVALPVDLDAGSPAAVLPRLVHDEKTGYAVFRDGWRGADDIVATLYAKKLARGRTGPAAGSFRIWGLGGRFAVQRATNAQSIEEENLVLGGHGNHTLGRVTHLAAGADGAGVVSLCMLTDPEKQQQWHLRAQQDSLPQRSFAADFSGACGAPGLFAVVDWRGRGERTWLMNTDPANRIDTAEGGFTIAAPSGATLRAVFAAPAGLRPTRSGAAVTASAEPSDFFVVMTLQRGPAPPVRIRGAGPKAVVSVGRRAVRFDGEKIVLSDAAVGP